MKGQEYCDCFPCSMGEATDDTLRHPKCDAIRFARAWEDGFSAGHARLDEAYRQGVEEMRERCIKEVRDFFEDGVIEELVEFIRALPTHKGADDDGTATPW